MGSWDSKVDRALDCYIGCCQMCESWFWICHGLGRKEKREKGGERNTDRLRKSGNSLCHLDLWVYHWLEWLTLVGRHDTQHNDTQHNNPHHNDTQHTNTQHSNTQHSNNQHNNTEHKDIQYKDINHGDKYVILRLVVECCYAVSFMLTAVYANCQNFAL